MMIENVIVLMAYVLGFIALMGISECLVRAAIKINDKVKKCRK